MYRFLTTILDILRKAGVKGTDQRQRITFARLDPFPGEYIQADYDGQSFFVRHAYFLYGGKGTKDGPHEKLKKALRAEIDEGEWSKLSSARSRPFDPPQSGKIAGKVINHFGDEVLKVYPIGK